MPSGQQKVSWNKTRWLSQSKYSREDPNWWQSQIIIFLLYISLFCFVEYIYICQRVIADQGSSRSALISNWTSTGRARAVADRQLTWNI